MVVVYEQNLDAPFLAASVDIRIAPLVAFRRIVGFSSGVFHNTIPFYFPWTLVVLKKHTSYAVKIKERHIL